MNYTLHQLQVFLKIVETKSITKAAEDLHLTQPAVSIQLKNLQEQFEIPLTEIVGRQLYVTDFGFEIAEIAKRINNEIQEIQFKTLAYKGHLTGTLKISVVSTAKYIIPFFLSDFLKLHPGIELEMDVTNKNKVVKSLQQNEIDFALVSIIPEKLNIEKIELMQNKLYCVGNMDEDFSSKNDMETIFQKRPLLFRENGSGTRQSMERFIQKNAIKIEKKMELTSNEAVKQSILAGIGYSIMPLIGIRKEIQNKELQIIPLKGLPIKTNWSLIWVKGKNHNPAALAYLDYLKKEKDAIIASKFGWYETI